MHDENMLRQRRRRLMMDNLFGAIRLLHNIRRSLADPSLVDSALRDGSALHLLAAHWLDDGLRLVGCGIDRLILVITNPRANTNFTEKGCD